MKLTGMTTPDTRLRHLIAVTPADPGWALVATLARIEETAGEIGMASLARSAHELRELVQQTIVAEQPRAATRAPRETAERSQHPSR